MEYFKTKNKKGNLTFETIYKVLSIGIFLAIIISIFLIIMYSAARDIPNTDNVESDLFCYNILTSNNGLSYFDPEINHVSIGTIDQLDFTSGNAEERINTFFDYGEENRYISAKITLTDDKLEPIHSIYYNKGENNYGYDYWEPLSSMKQGKNIPSYFIRVQPVNLRITKNSEEILTEANLIFEVIMPSEN